MLHGRMEWVRAHITVHGTPVENRAVKSHLNTDKVVLASSCKRLEWPCDVAGDLNVTKPGRYQRAVMKEFRDPNFTTR